MLRKVFSVRSELLLVGLGGNAGGLAVSRHLVYESVLSRLIVLFFLLNGLLGGSRLAQGADGEADLVLVIVDGGDLHFDLIADGKHVAGLGNAAVGDLGDVDQTVDPGHDLGEGAEVHELDDLDRSHIAHGVLGLEQSPGIGLGILVAEGDLALLGVGQRLVGLVYLLEGLLVAACIRMMLLRLFSKRFLYLVGGSILAHTEYVVVALRRRGHIFHLPFVCVSLVALAGNAARLRNSALQPVHAGSGTSRSKTRNAPRGRIPLVLLRVLGFPRRSARARDHHRGTDDPVSHLVALLVDLHDCFLGNAVVFGRAYRLVLHDVERLALRRDKRRGYPQNR